MKTNLKSIVSLVALVVLVSACKLGTSKEDDPTPSGGSNSFAATVDGKSWKANTASGGVAIVGGLLTIVGKIDDANEISIQMVGKDIQTGVDYLFEIPANETNKNANLLYKRQNNPLFAKSGKVRFSTFTNKKIEGTFDAQVSDFINANAEIQSGTFVINL
ncbi:hypothetical protein [Runella limosa]|uniref:hypothetical protein n=1 Tax=Runella limosa TaxID=370978 RepID=UPI000414EF77|nr:hypothetical protein [Runella limosa]